MRKIIFRGKPKSGYNYGNGWLYGSLIQIDENNYGIVELSDISYDENGYIDYSHTPVISETVGQFTGLTDKNGKEIYEGDIVKEERVRQDWERIIKTEVIFEIDFNDFASYSQKEAEKLEIIGNIYDNPSLLTNKE